MNEVGRIELEQNRIIDVLVDSLKQSNNDIEDLLIALKLKNNKGMTRGELVTMLLRLAKNYVFGASVSIRRNKHMNRYSGEYVSQDIINALIVDFVNFVAENQCMDLGFYTKDLYEKEK